MPPDLTEWIAKAEADWATARREAESAFGDGTLLIERGFVRPEDEQSEVPAGVESEDGPQENAPMDADHSASHSTVINMGGDTRPTEDDEDEGDAIKPLQSGAKTPATIVSAISARKSDMSGRA